jgi:hypothetical protein
MHELEFQSHHPGPSNRDWIYPKSPHALRRRRGRTLLPLETAALRGSSRGADTVGGGY